MNYCRIVCSFCGPSKPVEESEIRITNTRTVPGVKKVTRFTKCRTCGRQSVIEGHAAKETQIAQKEVTQKQKNYEEYSRIMERTRAELYRRMALAQQNEAQKSTDSDARQNGAQ